MGFDGQRRIAEHPWRFLLAMLCVLLVVLSGAVQAAHIHSDGADSHANCSLCATAHISIQLQQTPAPAQAAIVVAIHQALPPNANFSGLSTFALFNRPPPVDVVPA